MADEVDLANRKADAELQNLIELRRPAGPDATGFCHSCGDCIGPVRRWCNAICRNAWERTRR
jgi:hypothetical protein